MRKTSDNSIRISMLRVLGTLMMLCGIGLIVFSGARFVSRAQDEYFHKQEKNYSIGEAEDDDPGSYTDDEQADETSSRNTLAAFPALFFGACLIIGGLPLFYTAYDDPGMELRWYKRRKKRMAGLELRHKKASDDEDYSEEYDKEFNKRMSEYKRQLRQIQKNRDAAREMELDDDQEFIIRKAMYELEHSKELEKLRRWSNK